MEPRDCERLSSSLVSCLALSDIKKTEKYTHKSEMMATFCQWRSLYTKDSCSLNELIQESIELINVTADLHDKVIETASKDCELAGPGCHLNNSAWSRKTNIAY